MLIGGERGGRETGTDGRTGAGRDHVAAARSRAMRRHCETASTTMISMSCWSVRPSRFCAFTAASAATTVPISELETGSSTSVSMLVWRRGDGDRGVGVAETCARATSTSVLVLVVFEEGCCCCGCGSSWLRRRQRPLRPGLRGDLIDSAGDAGGSSVPAPLLVLRAKKSFGGRCGVTSSEDELDVWRFCKKHRFGSPVAPGETGATTVSLEELDPWRFARMFLIDFWQRSTFIVECTGNARKPRRRVRERGRRTREEDNTTGRRPGSKSGRRGDARAA